MTRYKEYLKEKGFKLEDDYPYLPFDGVETVETFIMDSMIHIRIYDNRVGWHGYIIYSDGEVLEIGLGI